ncbi:hypothetical protein C8K11_10447 [Novosphingobium sp. GV055]|uniref:hypothetical protein n=3 Tax=Sphingomonadaceae TaxID=41297 RepID=UPI000AECD943|nr:hypothetical protein [Novosphingobium capsulatum]PTR11690.1 hypothetical protein C8K11_10447 [Novosphingobium sp. GV055]PUB04730.1 hypothetical protein C8K12_10447 [Novosphingobium sp. GV061]PUB21049.1 hypothetical protein C8K14_10447 [Novosphingobium sp. GV079]PUB42775.1 hypothetical protein C8K10_10447 [Novosphingobium sp. GV027]WQD91824.1 hypothetical protein U0041_12535 [Novosphingobium capsulatum]
MALDPPPGLAQPARMLTGPMTAFDQTPPYLPGLAIMPVFAAAPCADRATVLDPEHPCARGVVAAPGKLQNAAAALP